ncbi:efflux RND transporter permease subunit [Candidatus Saccharibacteria bacterium]|nr:MAG: efflux RND transporter permease subunit [Candidatus Saccharibacteria bacterium]
MAKKTNQSANPSATPHNLQKFSLFFFHRPRLTAILALLLVVFGILSYTTFLKREGFPSISTPYALAQGTYFVNNPAKVDSEIAKPLSNFLLDQSSVKSVVAQSYGNFYTVIVSYDEGVDAAKETTKLQDEIKSQNVLPTAATLNFQPFKFGFTQEGDEAVISVTDTTGKLTTEQLTAKAAEAVTYLNGQKMSLVDKLRVVNQFETGAEGQVEQKSFERYGLRANEQNRFYNSVLIGVSVEKGADYIKLDKQMTSAVDSYNAQAGGTGTKAYISASYAPSIRQQVGELQKTLLEGLLAVLIVGSIIIAVRASIITVLSMLTVLAITIGVLFVIGYTLNTITLFALILGLSLIVDDTIIMVEALDARRRRSTDPDEIVQTSVGKVGRAMIAATSTAALSFAPLIFVGGIIGSFIRQLPITIIIALVVSLLVALVIIPLYARFFLLGKKHLGKQAEREVASNFEAKIARFISAPMLWAQHSKLKLAGVGLAAVFISVLFIGGGGYLFSKVTFNIFPASKDTNQIMTTLKFPAGTDISEAQAISDRADKLIGQTIGANFVQSANLGQANAQGASTMIDLTDYNSRSETAPQIIAQLKQAFSGFEGAAFTASSVDAGPPAADFTVQIATDSNREAAEKLAADIAAYLKKAQLKRLDGSVVKVESVDLANSDVFTRQDGKAYVAVTIKFADTDTTTLVTLAKDAVNKEFTAAKVQSYGLPSDTLSFNAGQEDENQDSFKTMALAFPILLLVIYLLLAVQFRSLLQPLLIFMAIPFSLFGITLGLYITDNAFSFFALLGFFALIGLSIKNTILLVDYANQARRAGMNPVDAAHEALAQRFRPLIATSLTAIFSLIPLALSSPFWQGLCVVLIFGLLSSTFLVITVFPYYYLGGEFFRGIFRRRISSPVKRKLRRA